MPVAESAEPFRAPVLVAPASLADVTATPPPDTPPKAVDQRTGVSRSDGRDTVPSGDTPLSTVNCRTNMRGAPQFTMGSDTLVHVEVKTRCLRLMCVWLRMACKMCTSACTPLRRPQNAPPRLPVARQVQHSPAGKCCRTPSSPQPSSASAGHTPRPWGQFLC